MRPSRAIRVALLLLAACRTARGPVEETSLPPARDPRRASEEAERTSDPVLAFEIAYVEGNDRRLARARIEDALKAQPADPQLLLRRAVLDMAELRHDDALADLLALIAKAPATSEAEIALVFLNAGLTESLADAAALEKAVDASQILEGRALSAPRAALASAIASRLDALRRDETAMLVHMAQGGWIAKWRAAGPLAPRTSMSLQKPTALELGPFDPKAIGENRGFVPPIRVLPVHRYNTNPVAGDQSGLYVMESYFEVGDVARGRPLEVDIHMRDPGRVRIDGVKIHEIFESQARSPGDRRVRLELRPGWHRLAVALLATNASRPTVSILGADGGPVIVAQSETPPASGLRSNPPDVAGQVPADEKSSGDSLIERLSADPKHALFGRLLGTKVALSAFREDYERARALLQPALESAPVSAALIAADAELMYRTGLPASLSQARFRDALKADESNPEMLIALARSVQNDSPETALSLIDRAEKASPKAVEPHELRFGIFRQKGWNAEAASSLDLALARRPSEALLSEGASFFRGLSQIGRALELEKRALDLAEPSRASREANAALLGGDLERAIDALGEAARTSIGAAAFHARIAELELGRGRVDRAVEAAEIAIAEDPLHAGALRTLAAALHAKGDEKRALETIDRLRAIGAADVHLERLAAEITGLPFAHPKPGSLLAAATALDLRKLADPAADDADLRWSKHKSVRILDRVVDYVRKDGHALSVRHAITRLQTKEATDQAGEIHLPGEAVPLALRTLKANGRIIDVDRHPGKDDLSFSALAPGDAVEKEWVGIDHPATPWGGYARRFFFQGASPALRAEYVVVVPHGTKVWWKSYNGAPEPEVKSESGEDIYIFKKRDVAAVDPEPNSVPHEEYLAFVAVAVGVDEAMALRTNALSAENMASGGIEVKRAAEAIAKGVRGEENVVSSVYGWLSREIGHGGARDPEIVLATRRGDRTGLFVAMLRALNIDAEIALGRAGASPRVSPPYPNAGRYNVELVRVRLKNPKKTLWARMDLQTPWIGKVTPDLRGGDYILPEASADKIEPIAFSDEEIDRWALSSSVELAVDAEGTAKGTVSIALPGAYGSDLREFLRRARKEDVERALQAWVALILPGAKLERYASSNTDETLDALKLETAVVVPHFMVVESGHLIAEQFFNVPIATRALGFPTLATYIRVPNRSTPLYVSELGEEMTIQVTLPDSAGAPVEAPRIFVKDEPWGRFVQEFSFDPAQRTAKMFQAQSLAELRLSPKEFETFRDEAQEILQATRNRLIVPLKTQPNSAQK